MAARSTSENLDVCSVGAHHGDIGDRGSVDTLRHRQSSRDVDVPPKPGFFGLPFFGATPGGRSARLTFG